MLQNQKKLGRLNCATIFGAILTYVFPEHMTDLDYRWIELRFRYINERLDRVLHVLRGPKGADRKGITPLPKDPAYVELLRDLEESRQIARSIDCSL